MTDHTLDTPAVVAIQPEPEYKEQVAGQWQLIWWRFRRNRIALISGAIVIAIYLVAIFAEFLAPFSPDFYEGRYAYAQPQQLHFFQSDENGTRFAPYVNGFSSSVDPVSFRRTFVPDPEKIVPVAFFAKGEPYLLFGLIPAQHAFHHPGQSARPDVSVRRRPAGARRAQPHHSRHARVDVDRADRGDA